MSSPHRSLAARFRTAVRRQREHENDDEARRLDQEEAVQRSREDLLDQLEDFAEAAEFFSISRAESSLLLRYEGRRLRFEFDRREPILNLRGSQLPPNSCIRFQPTRRIWQIHYGGPRRLSSTIDLYPNGLQRLITRVFDIQPASVVAVERAAVRAPPEATDGAPQASRFWRST